MYSLYILTGLLALVSSKPCDPATSDHSELLLSLNKKLLRSLQEKATIPNPSVHLALRLSHHHNLAKENNHLTELKTKLHNDIESSLIDGQPVAGRLALYILALKASCYDINTLTFTVKEKSDTLLTVLKSQMDLEQHHIALTNTKRPLTNYYQYSLGMLALCVSGVRENKHISNKLIKAVEDGHIKHGESDCIDTFAMAGMALQCLKEVGSHGVEVEERRVLLEKALGTIKQKLLDSRQADGHMGNEFSTGLAVQALLAMGSQVEECATSMDAMRSDFRKGTYVNPMALSQSLPALQQKSYLQIKNKQCRNEDDSLVLTMSDPVRCSDDVVPSQTKVPLKVQVMMSSGAAAVFPVDVPTGVSLLKALELLQKKNSGFTFEKESSLWGVFLSEVNGERARQSDRRYWQLSSEGAVLKHGISDFKIETAQQITIKNTEWGS